MSSNTNYILSNTIKTYKIHPSIINIQTNCNFVSHFNFVQVSEIDIGKTIETIDSSKGILSAI